MTLTAALEGASNLLMQVANPAARAVLLAGAAGLALSASRVKATSTRLFTWTAVLYASLAMPVLGWLLPPVSVPALSFPQYETSPAASNDFSRAQPVAVAAVPSPAKGAPIARDTRARNTSSDKAIGQISSSSATSSTRPSFSWLSIPWSAVAAGIYLAVALLLLVRFFVGLLFAHRLIQTSRTMHEPRATQRLASRAYACGLASVPRAGESELISVPVTIGALRSTILLPTSWRDWDDAKLDAVVAHEVSHVVRRDALTQRLSLLHRAIFWFSPLAWWLDRHLADLAEQASDEAALLSGANRSDYARTLLGFFESLHAAPGRVWWQGVSMAKAGQAEQRVERILAWRGAVTMSLKKSGMKKSIIVAIIALAIPVVYLTAAVRPGGKTRPLYEESSQDQPPAAPAVPHAQPQPAPVAATPAIASITPPAPAAPVAAATPPPGAYELMVAPPAMPVTAWARQSRTSRSYGRGNSYSYAYGDDDEQRFVIASGKSDSYTMSGSTQDIRHVEKLKKQISGDFIWFQRDEQSYIIRDQATIERARQLWAPQEELGKKQEELGKQQEGLGKQQEELGEKMEKVHVKVPDMTAQLDKLRAELKQMSSGATLEQVSNLQSEIGELQSKIGEIQSQAGEQQGELGERQGELGEKQGKLGELQGELGRQQGELAEKASRQMRELLDESITKGLAQPEPETGKKPLL
jgi:beta-lactamase regulating signal transducer with metallopeptidase domain